MTAPRDERAEPEETMMNRSVSDSRGAEQTVSRRPDDPYTLPEGLPVPEDDGACEHLEGMSLPAGVRLPSTEGVEVDLAEASAGGRVVVYCYPLTGVPGEALPEGWDLVPGARGCTPEACAFRDHHGELRRLEAEAVFGLSTQTTGYQRDLARRLHLPFGVLSDSDLRFAQALGLPTFQIEKPTASQPSTLIKRLTLVLLRGAVEKVFYPVFPPDRHAEEVAGWLSENAVP
jgi:peroxiredoxin